MEELDVSQISLLKDYEKRFDELISLTQSVEVVSDNKLLRFYQSELSTLQDAVLLFKKLKATESDIEEFSALSGKFDESEIRPEIERLTCSRSETILQIKAALSAMKPAKFQKTIVEVQTRGGDAKFLGEFRQMLIDCFEKSKYEFSVTFEDEKSVNFEVSGNCSTENLSKFCGDVKFVSRGEESNILCVVLDKPVSDFKFDLCDVKFQISKSSGAGGQHINKTESNVKAIHTPTGLSANCQNNRSQTQNKEMAVSLLKGKVEKFYAKNSENYIKNQRKQLKNAIFSNTSNLIFDFDRNEVQLNSTKSTQKLADVKTNSLKILL